jgi:hypothetical protein
MPQVAGMFIADFIYASVKVYEGIVVGRIDPRHLNGRRRYCMIRP